MIALTVIRSPVGPLALAAREGRVCLVQFATEHQAAGSGTPRELMASAEGALARWYSSEPVREATDPAGAAGALSAYFDGDCHAIARLQVELNGTPFQQTVWRALRTIPAGATCSYRELATRIGAPSAVRAVGAANGANPVAIIVPCHRVIGAKGTLIGYGGGLERKRWLLQHEGSRRSLFAG